MQTKQGKCFNWHCWGFLCEQVSASRFVARDSKVLPHPEQFSCGVWMPWSWMTPLPPCLSDEGLFSSQAREEMVLTVLKVLATPMGYVIVLVPGKAHLLNSHNPGLRHRISMCQMCKNLWGGLVPDKGEVTMQWNHQGTGSFPGFLSKKTLGQNENVSLKDNDSDQMHA